MVFTNNQGAGPVRSDLLTVTISNSEQKEIVSYEVNPCQPPSLQVLDDIRTLIK